jgi:hypothetical protein
MKKEKLITCFSLMLDPQFKKLHLVSSFVGHEQNIYIVEKYDQKSLQPMLLKCYHHLHLVEKYDVESIEHISYEYSNLDIFEMTISTNEPVAELVNKKLLILGDFKWIFKRSNALYNGGKNMSMFPIVGFLA